MKTLILSICCAGSFFAATLEAKEPASFREVEQVLEQAVAEKAFPGCSAIVGTHDKILWHRAFGFVDDAKSHIVTNDTVYDLASLTKVVGTTSVAIQLFQQKKYRLDDPVMRWIPEFADKDPRKPNVTIRQLLTHTGGLPSWKPYYKSVKNYEELLAMVIPTPLETDPGAKYRYSDLGMMLLGETLARIEGDSLEQLERELVFTPLKMTETLRNPPQELLPRIAPTERIGETEKFIHGVVHDENAQAGAGKTGHAGLFSTTGDLAELAQWLLQAYEGKPADRTSVVIRQFTAQQKLPGDARRALGWQIFSPGSSGGSLLSETAFGHTGFTGTSMWIDPERDLFLILLSNRVHPTRDNKRHIAVRRDFADAVIRATQSSE